MKIKLVWQFAIVVLGLAVFASASPVTVTFTSTDNNLGGPTQGVYYYPYQLTVNGSSVTVACDDYFNEVYLGESWQATVNTFATLSNTLFGSQANALQKYEEAAWLFTQFESVPLPVNNVNAAINFAMWDLFDSSAPGINTSQSSSNTSSTYWLNLAQEEYAAGFAGTGIDFSQFVFYTPTSGWPSADGQPQEYIGEVPEPSTVLLWMTGLAGLGLVEWRRRQQAAA